MSMLKLGMTVTKRFWVSAEILAALISLTRYWRALKRVDLLLLSFIGSLSAMNYPILKRLNWATDLGPMIMRSEHIWPNFLPVKIFMRMPENT